MTPIRWFLTVVNGGFLGVIFHTHDWVVILAGVALLIGATIQGVLLMESR